MAATCAQTCFQQTGIDLSDMPPGRGRAEPVAGPDPLLAEFVRAVLPPEQASEVMAGYYTDAFHATLLQRLSALRLTPAQPRGGRRVHPLPRWKLRQVVEHVDANIGERITLGSLAATAGLSEMHFAAQFKIATGQRPHDYVLHRRIAHARRMLAETSEPIVQVALAVGFQTQAHFTTAFKRVTGFTPKHWRQTQAAPRPARDATGGAGRGLPVLHPMMIARASDAHAALARA